MTKQPTLTQFKQWAKDAQPAAKAVLMARVFAQMERERVDAYIRPIFQSYKFKVREEWRGLERYPDGIITDPKDLYLCNDDGAEGDEVRMYFEDCDKAHRAHGFTGPHGHCPALIAENLVMTAERLLIELAEPLCGIEADRIYGENRTKYVELLLSSCFVKDGQR